MNARDMLDSHDDTALTSPADAHPLSLRRKELRLIDRVYSAEDALLQQAARTDRDEAALEAALSMLADSEATTRDKRTALRLLERVNTRLDNRAKWMIQNTTERLRIKASVAADTVRTWQPNGTRPSNFDPELQAMIDGAGRDIDDDTG